MVTTGDYSDYGIFSIHSTEDKAIEVVTFLKRIGGYMGNSADYYEQELDSFRIPMIPDKHRAYMVHIYPQGEAMVFDHSQSITGIEYAAEGCEYDNDAGGYITYVFARDKEHALKIARDRRAKHFAKKEGLA